MRSARLATMICCPKQLAFHRRVGLTPHRRGFSLSGLIGVHAMLIHEVARSIARARLRDTDTEYLLWISFALLINGGLWLEALFTGGFYADIVVRHYVTIIFGIMVCIFPILFLQIFDKFPFQMLRDRVSADVSVTPRETSDATPDATGPPTQYEKVSRPDAQSASTLAALDGATLLALNALASDKLARNIYTRAGVYMMTGALVAFSGLLFFYFQTARVVSADITGIVVFLAPKFGILIFIEVVAFFFLRQYRAAMDEFRYFEAVKRRREETLALVRLNEGASSPLTIIEMIEKGVYSSGQFTFNQDQTTELLEARKLEKNELMIIEKIIDAMSVRRAA